MKRTIRCRTNFNIDLDIVLPTRTISVCYITVPHLLEAIISRSSSFGPSILLRQVQTSESHHDMYMGIASQEFFVQWIR